MGIGAEEMERDGGAAAKTGEEPNRADSSGAEAAEEGKEGGEEGEVGDQEHEPVSAGKIGEGKEAEALHRPVIARRTAFGLE
jgi:hypothetical protein